MGFICINGIASLTVRLHGVSGKLIRLFTENNYELFTSLHQYTRKQATLSLTDN